MNPPLDRTLLAASWRSWVAGDLRRVGPYALQWLWTLLLAGGIALVFTLLSWLVFNPRSPSWQSAAGWGLSFGRHLVVCLTIGAVVQLLYDLGGLLIGGPTVLRRLAGWQRTLFTYGLPLLGVTIGWPVGLTLAGIRISSWVTEPAKHGVLAAGVVLTLLTTLIVLQIFAAKAQRYEAERRATEAQLRLLQGQMEPHFLFNTLANVDALIDADPARARAMLGAFTELLRVSLSQLRRDECTLGDELALAEHYLRLMQFRMEDRLHFRIQASEAARRVPVAPLLLQPLVENAVAHGIEPRLDGGIVHVAAAVDAAGGLVVTVRDEGRGIAAPAPSRGNGIALANLRQRLLARHGSAAALEVAVTDRGSEATLRLPAGRAGAP